MPRPKGVRDASYPAKRSALLQKLSARLARLNDTRPSLRQLAAAADVTVPTLRHYFGSREELVEAVFADFNRLGAEYLQSSAKPCGDLSESIRDFLNSLLRVMTDGTNLGDMFAVGLVEGMLNRRLGPAYLTCMTDPLVDALAERLRLHQARGEMIEADPRFVALMLISPVVVACNHQNQMFGRRARPLDLEKLIGEMASAFVRAYGEPGLNARPASAVTES